jgi:hypothetical protein
MFPAGSGAPCPCSGPSGGWGSGVNPLPPRWAASRLVLGPLAHRLPARCRSVFSALLSSRIEGLIAAAGTLPPRQVLGSWRIATTASEAASTEQALCRPRVSRPDFRAAARRCGRCPRANLELRIFTTRRAALAMFCCGVGARPCATDDSDAPSIAKMTVAVKKTRPGGRQTVPSLLTVPSSGTYANHRPQSRRPRHGNG